jgi:two-component system CheB/CheR fusion protein
VIPLHLADKRHFLVLFEPGHESGAPAATEPPAPPAPDDVHRVRSLEDELAASRTYLQSIIQELEAANEELQSANEEILSSNEELQSTNEELDTAKEELQSTNKELNTVNDELHGRNEELSRANSDLMNILSSVQIAILIVSIDLRIRRFTPMAERMLNLIATDVGRPIGHIKPNIDCPELEKLIHEVIDTIAAVERPVQDRQGNWFSLRIRPYKSVDNRIDGAVLALFDIDAIRRQELELRALQHYAEAIVQAIRHPLVVLEADLRVRTANPAFLASFRLDAREVTGRKLGELDGAGWNTPAIRAALETAAGGTRRVERVEFEHDFPRVGRRRIVAHVRGIEGPAGRPPLVLVALDETCSSDTGATDGSA